MTSATIIRRPAALCAAVAALAVTASAAPADAKDITYKGKTREGVSVTLVERAGKIRNIKTGMPVVCLSTNRPGQSMSGADPWDLTASFAIGRKSEDSGVWKTSMWWRELTVTVKTDIRRTRRGLSGSLGESFQFMVPTFPMPQTINYACQGATTFTARRV